MYVFGYHEEVSRNSLSLIKIYESLDDLLNQLKSEGYTIRCNKTQILEEMKHGWMGFCIFRLHYKNKYTGTDMLGGWDRAINYIHKSMIQKYTQIDEYGKKIQYIEASS